MKKITWKQILKMAVANVPWYVSFSRHMVAITSIIRMESKISNEGKFIKTHKLLRANIQHQRITQLKSRRCAHIWSSVQSAPSAPRIITET